MSLTHLINAHHSAYVDGMAALVTTPFVWLPLALMLLYLIIRGSRTMVDVVRCVLLLSLAVAVSQVCGYFLSGLIYGPGGSSEWALRDGIVQTLGARQYGLYSLLTANAICVAVFVSLLVCYRRLTFTLLFWAVLNAWARVYLGAGSVAYELSCLAVGAAFGFTAWETNRLLLRRSGAATEHNVTPLRTRTGFATADCRLVICAAAFLFLLITFLPVF